ASSDAAVRSDERAGELVPGAGAVRAVAQGDAAPRPAAAQGGGIPQGGGGDRRGDHELRPVAPGRGGSAAGDVGAGGPGRGAEDQEPAGSQQRGGEIDRRAAEDRPDGHAGGEPPG